MDNFEIAKRLLGEENHLLLNKRNLAIRRIASMPLNVDSGEFTELPSFEEISKEAEILVLGSTEVLASALHIESILNRHGRVKQ